VCYVLLSQRGGGGEGGKSKVEIKFVPIKVSFTNWLFSYIFLKAVLGISQLYSAQYSISYTVTRIDGILHQPHRMAPDQTIRVMGDKFDICDGHIQFFPTFPMEIFDRFEVFRLNSLYTGWKSSTFRSFPIIFPLHRMEIFDRFEVFRLYTLYTGWKSSTFRSFPIIFPLQRMEIADFSKISDYIHFAKDGNTRRFEIFCLYSLSKEGNH
jgi:hypothetical protein